MKNQNTKAEAAPAPAGGHTLAPLAPKPWRVRGNGWQIEDVDTGLIAQTHDDCDQPGVLPHPGAVELAHEIVATCNSHASLLAERDGLKDLLLHTQRAAIEVAEERDRLRAALILALERIHCANLTRAPKQGQFATDDLQ